MNFGSDNTAPVHPRIMEAVTQAGAGYASPYGGDPNTDRATAMIREVFEAPEAEVFFVATGSAANSLALATLVEPWQAIFCSRVAHIHTDECGAPEFYTGGSKLVLVPETDARMTPADLEAAITEGADRGLHYVQPGAVSITQVTECGTVYPRDRIAAIGRVAKRHALPLHMDGARFANALATLDCSAADMTWKTGVDAVSFGGTKNGMMAAEAVILFDPARTDEMTFRRKRGGQLWSKHRFLAAQFEAALSDGLWLDMARAANGAAAHLSRGLAALDHARLLHPTEANMIFVALPRAAHRRAIAAGADYFLGAEDLEGGQDDDPIPVRLVTNWSTTGAEVDRFLNLVS